MRLPLRLLKVPSPTLQFHLGVASAPQHIYFSTSSLLCKSEAPLPPRKVIPESDYTVAYLKGSGPGGQKINKTSSAVQIRHLPSGIVIKCQDTRSRDQNRKLAMRRLQDRLEYGEKSGTDEVSRLERRWDMLRKRKERSRKKSVKKYAASDDDDDDQGDDEDLEGESTPKPKTKMEAAMQAVLDGKAKEASPETTRLESTLRNPNSQDQCGDKSANG